MPASSMARFPTCVAQNYETAAVEILDSAYATQVGKRAIELAGMIRTGNAVEV